MCSCSVPRSGTELVIGFAEPETSLFDYDYAHAMPCACRREHERVSATSNYIPGYTEKPASVPRNDRSAVRSRFIRDGTIYKEYSVGDPNDTNIALFSDTKCSIKLI